MVKLRPEGGVGISQAAWRRAVWSRDGKCHRRREHGVKRPGGRQERVVLGTESSSLQGSKELYCGLGGRVSRVPGTHRAGGEAGWEVMWGRPMITFLAC